MVETAEFIVIGAGIAGAAAGYWLAPLGLVPKRRSAILFAAPAEYEIDRRPAALGAAEPALSPARFRKE